MLGVVVVITVFALCGAFILFLYMIDTIIDDRRKEKYPKFFELLDKVNQKGNECSSYYTNEIISRENQIDAILKEWNYYTDTTKEQKQADLARLRQELEEAKAENDILSNELHELRLETKAFVYRNKLKWAMRMGW